MNYKMIDLKGIDETQVAQLNGAGVENTNEIMEVWNDPTKRAALLSSAALSDDQLSVLVAMARVARMRGVGPRYANLLVSAGVKGRKSLATFSPEGLFKHLGEVNAAKSLGAPLPTLGEVGSWFAQLGPRAVPGALETSGEHEPRP